VECEAGSEEVGEGAWWGRRALKTLRSGILDRGKNI